MFDCKIPENLLPYNDPTQLASCVDDFTNGDNDRNFKAQKIFSEMKKNVYLFTDSLFSLMLNDSITKETRTGIQAVLKSMLIPNIRDQSIKNDEWEYIYNAMLKTIYAQELDLSVKKSLKSLFVSLLKDKEEEDRENGLKTLTIKNLSDMCGSLLGDKLNGTLKDIISSILLLKFMILAKKKKHHVSDMFKKVQEDLVKAGSHLIMKVGEDLATITVSSDPKEIILNTVESINGIKAWISLINTFIKIFSTKQTTSRTEVANYTRLVYSQDSIYEILQSCIDIGILSGNQLPNCFFSTSGIIQVDQALNRMKQTAIKCVNLVLELVEKSGDPAIRNNNRFFAHARNVSLQRILDSILIFCESFPEIQVALKDEELEQCLVASLKFIGFLSSEPPLILIHKRVIMNVCLPLMETGSSELRLFEHYPKEFVKLSLDVCVTQKSKFLKSAAANLIEHICDDIDTAKYFLFKILLAIIEYSLIENDSEKLWLYPALQEYKNNIFLTKTDKIIRIETCITILTIITYTVFEDLSLIEALEGFLASFSEHLYNIKSHPLISSRMCLFISYTFDTLFIGKDLDDFIALEFTFILSCMKIPPDKTKSCLSEQAADTLLSILDNKSNLKKITPFIEEIIDAIGFHIKKTQDPEFLRLVFANFWIDYRKLLLGNPKRMHLLVKFLCDKLLSIYSKENKSGQNSHDSLNEDDKRFVDSAWDALYDLSKEKVILNLFQDQIEQALGPFFRRLKENHLEFLHRVPLYMMNVVETTETVSSVFWENIRSLPTISSNPEDFFDCFKLFNYIVLLGKNTLSHEPNLINFFVEISLQGLKSLDSKNIEYFHEAASLLQRMFLEVDFLSDQNWEKMIRAISSYIPETKVDDCRILAQTLLCAFIANFELTWRITREETLSPITLRFINFCIQEAVSFPQKEIVMEGLCSFLTFGLDDSVILEILPQLLNSIITLFQFKELEIHQKKRKNLRKKKHETTIGEESDDYDRSDDDDNLNNEDGSENSEMKEDNLWLLQQQEKRYMYNLNVFKKAVGLVKKTKTEIFEDLIKQLSHDKAQYLDKIFKADTEMDS